MVVLATMKTALTKVLMVVIIALPMLALVSTGIAEAQLETKPTFEGGIVSCTGVSDKDGGVPCNWCSFVQLIGNMIQYSIYLAVMLSALMFAYAGFLFLTNNGNEANITKAWSIFRRSLMGTVAILAAWLIVNAIMTKLATGLGLGDNWNSITGCSEITTSTAYRSDVNIGGTNRTVPTNYPTNTYDNLTSGIDGYLVDDSIPGTVVGNTTVVTAIPDKKVAGEVGIRLRNAKIVVNSSGNCTDNKSNCTYLKGLNEETVKYAENLKNSCGSGCSMRITGAAEPGHWECVGNKKAPDQCGLRGTHSGGAKIDIGTTRAGDTKVSQYIQQRVTFVSNTSIGKKYKDSCGNFYIKENNHWDIQVFRSSLPGGGSCL